MKTLRWGFLSTAHIARKNWNSILHSGNNTLVAVASRDIARSRSFIEQCQASAPFAKAPTALGSYEELLASPEVDAVYIPMPTALRRDWVVRAARAGKHVLCEKPCAANLADLETMLAACRDNRVQFMDGVMFMHHPRLEHMRAMLDDGKSIGGIRRIMTIFSFRPDAAFFKNNIRVMGNLEPAGCLGDVGWYCIRFILWAMRWQMPVEVNAKIISASDSGANAVPTEFSGELVFADGASAGFFCSFTTNQQWVNLSGESGWLRVEDFVAPNDDAPAGFVVNGTHMSVPPNSGDSSENPPPVRLQHVNMFRNFADQVSSGELNTDWPGKPNR